MSEGAGRGGVGRVEGLIGHEALCYDDPCFLSNALSLSDREAERQRELAGESRRLMSGRRRRRPVVGAARSRTRASPQRRPSTGASCCTSSLPRHRPPSRACLRVPQLCSHLLALLEALDVDRPSSAPTPCSRRSWQPTQLPSVDPLARSLPKLTRPAFSPHLNGQSARTPTSDGPAELSADGLLRSCLRLAGDQPRRQRSHKSRTPTTTTS